MSESPSSSTTTSSSSIESPGSPTQRVAFGFAPSPSTTRKRRRTQRRPRAKAAAWSDLDLARAITRTADPPPSNAPINPRPILSSPEHDGFFVLASCIFHACVNTETESHPQPRTHVIETVRCPAHLRIIAKNNLGFNNDHSGNFMDALTSVVRNQMSASDIIKETANVSLTGVAAICAEETSEKSTLHRKMARATHKQLVKLWRLNELITTECSKMRREIVQLTHAALDDAEQHSSPFKQVAIVFDHSDRCNRLVTSLENGILTLLDEDGATFDASHLRHMSGQLDRGNFVSYGDPKTRYLPTKTYYVTEPIPALPATASAADRFIKRQLEDHLHLSVGLRLDGQMHTLQANVDLPALQPVVTLHEIVQLLMDPRLKARIVELMREQHPHLAVKNPGPSGWDVALFDGGCSGIQGISGCPMTVHVPSSSGKRKPQALLSAALPREEVVHQPNAVPWDLEPIRRPVPIMHPVRLRKMEKYLAPGESPFQVNLSAFFQPSTATATTTTTATEERSSNDTEPPQTPRGILEEGGSRRRRHIHIIKTKKMKIRRKLKK